MATYLVTGGAGFIGSHLAEELCRRGESVRVLDNLSTGSQANLAGLNGPLAFYRRDIRDLEGMRPVFEGVDYVIHEAALPSVPRSIADPLTSHAVNLDGTLNVLVAARDASVRRVVFAATSAAYGDSLQLPCSESQEPRPLSPYALAKVAGEQYCGLFGRLYGLETVALRYFNVFGPRQDPDSPYSGVLSKFLAAYLRGAPPTIFGDGEQSRDFIYVANVVDATLRACTAPGASGHVINIGTGNRVTLNHTIQVLDALFGRKTQPRYAPPRPGDVLHSQADISLARRLLGYQPQVGFEEGLRRSLEWYRTACGL
jgi:nucleoside-diphosphate-sugar epimerase